MGCATVPVPFTGEHTVKGKSENFKMTRKHAVQGPVCLCLALACEAGPWVCPSPSLLLETMGSTAVSNGTSAAGVLWLQLELGTCLYPGLLLSPRGGIQAKGGATKTPHQ